MKQTTYIEFIVWVCVAVFASSLVSGDFCDGNGKEETLPEHFKQTVVLTKAFKRNCMFPLIGPHDLVSGNCSDISSGFSFTSATTCNEPNPEGFVTQKYTITILPPGNNATLTSTIYCVTILNRGGDENWGTVFIDDGGFGTNFIDVRIESQKYKGLRYETTLYVRTEPK